MRAVEFKHSCELEVGPSTSPLTMNVIEIYLTLCNLVLVILMVFVSIMVLRNLLLFQYIGEFFDTMDYLEEESVR